MIESGSVQKGTLYSILAGLFITNAIVAELIGGKLIYVGPNLMSIGILPWPIVFLTTDLINEYFGAKAVRRLSFITAGFIVYCFVILLIALHIPAAEIPGNVSDSAFQSVFGQSLWIILGSVTAFLFSQLIDVTVFHFFKRRTGKKFLWLRSTGSTVISQFFDSFIVLGIAFYLTGKMTAEQYLASGLTGYSVKIFIAILLTPLIYLVHWIIDKFVLKPVAANQDSI